MRDSLSIHDLCRACVSRALLPASSIVVIATKYHSVAFSKTKEIKLLMSMLNANAPAICSIF